MKKSELTQLTQVIEMLVERAIRKQLPVLLGEAFKNMAGKSMVTERVVHMASPAPVDCIGKEVEEPEQPEVFKDPNRFKASLKELFAGVTPVAKSRLEEGVAPVAHVTKQYTKNPVLNQILNETTPDLRARERMTGMAAFQGGYNPGMPVAAPEGGMPTSIPMGTPPVLREGQESSHVPLSALPEGVSALDVARQVPLAQPVAQALTRNYRDMMKLIDAKRGKK